MPATDWGWEVTAAELDAWTVADDGDVLVVNKPGGVVCHPSKHGPWSSLVGAVRARWDLPRVHMLWRLDRETSGVMAFARERATGSRLQAAVEGRRTAKAYLAILEGVLAVEAEVDRPLGRDRFSGIASRMAVDAGPEGRPARTVFTPLASGGGRTLARVRPLAGRQHQIRVHAAWLGHPVAGDKLYGPDPSLYLEFVEAGWTPRLAARLPLRRQALHALEVAFEPGEGGPVFRAPLADDLVAFAAERLGLRVGPWGEVGGGTGVGDGSPQAGAGVG